MKSYREWIRSVSSLFTSLLGPIEERVAEKGQWLMVVVRIGTGDSNDVLAQYPRCRIENEDAAGV